MQGAAFNRLLLFCGSRIFQFQQIQLYGITLKILDNIKCISFFQEQEEVYPQRFGNL
jgi:hypothetical protein